MKNKLRISSTPMGYYYTPMTARNMKYYDYLEKVDAVTDITESIERNTQKQIAVKGILAERINSSIVDAQVASAKALHNNIQAVNRTLMGGFVGVSRSFQPGFTGISNQLQAGLTDLIGELEGVSRQVGVMRAGMNTGFARLNDSIQESTKAICERLDDINDILNNPFLTKTRELYRRALTEYTKGFYQEALEDLREAVKGHRTDALSWFLLGKTYLFGRGVFSEVEETVDVIDLDTAMEAFRNAAKYILPETKTLEGARRMAAEIWFYLGLAQQTKSGDLTSSGETAASQNYIRQAQRSFEQSWNYSQEMLEARYNAARCKVFQGDVPGALQDLETVILRDRWYCIKIADDPDFDAVKDGFHALLDRMKRAVYPQAKGDFDRVQALKGGFEDLRVSPSSELAQLMEAHLPDTFTEAMPYLDIREGKEVFPQIRDLLEKEIQAAKRRQQELRWQEEHQRLLQVSEASFIHIAGGTFTMGSPRFEPTRKKDEYQHRVTVSSFYMGKYEVTQAEYQELMGTNLSNFKGDDLPVERVSWYDAIEYCNKRSKREGLTPAYRIDKSRKDPNNKSKDDELKWSVTWNRNADGYRLPTEAEWEYACRAETVAPFNTGDTITPDQANYDGNYPYNGNARGTYREKTMPVGSFAPNGWGLYDMHGNVEEWCWDWYGSYSKCSQTDPVGAVTGAYRVSRGGSWFIDGQSLRSAYRLYSAPSGRYYYLGFRLVRNK